MIKLHSITWDGDGGTHTHLFTSEAALAEHVKAELSEEWAADTGRPFPVDWREAWEKLSDRPRQNWWLSTDTHQLDLASVPTDELRGCIRAAQREIETREKPRRML